MQSRVRSWAPAVQTADKPRDERSPLTPGRGDPVVRSNSAASRQSLSHASRGSGPEIGRHTLSTSASGHRNASLIANEGRAKGTGWCLLLQAHARTGRGRAHGHESRYAGFALSVPRSAASVQWRPGIPEALAEIPSQADLCTRAPPLAPGPAEPPRPIQGGSTRGRHPTEGQPEPIPQRRPRRPLILHPEPLLGIQELDEALNEPVDLPRVQLALPDDEHAPPHPPKLTSHSLVTSLVSLELVSPERDSCLGQSIAQLAAMPMPEAAMNEHHALSRRENEVRRAWKVATVKPVTITASMQSSAHHHLGARVAAPDLGHLETPLRSRQ